MSDLIEPDELDDWLTATSATDQGPAGPVILDVRWQLGGPSSHPDFLHEHLPGAQWVDLDRDLSDPAGARGRHPLPSAERLQRLVDRVQIAEGQSVVVYDAADSMAAARAWWTLRWAGIDDVRVLDGGLAGWRAHGLPLESGPTPRGAPVIAARVRTGALPTLDADSAAALARSGRLVDARTRERYLGEHEPVDAVAGRIPGSLNVPTVGDVDAAGRFLAPDVLRRRFAGLADRSSPSMRSSPVGVYCGSGVSAAHSLLAMKLAGVDALLYPGSWSEWISDPARPVERGEPPAP